MYILILDLLMNNQETYDVAVASFFAAGGDGFDIKGNIIEHTLTGNI